jgi:hypothetical protein
MILYAAKLRHSHSRPVPRPAPELVWHRFEDEARMMVPGDKMRCPYRLFIKATMYGPNGCMGLFGLFIFIYIYICVCKCHVFFRRRQAAFRLHSSSSCSQLSSSSPDASFTVPMGLQRHWEDHKVFKLNFEPQYPLTCKL